MKIVKPKYQIVLPFPDWDTARVVLYQAIEKAGRTCYKSESRITPQSAEAFVRRMAISGHEAMLEHASLTIRFTVDRGISHELVRHRMASFAQESTRYCDYSSGRFGEELTFIRPCFLKEGTPEYELWSDTMRDAESTYMQMLKLGLTPQEARSVLPNSLKTEVVMTANMREWRHFFRLRAIGTTGAPHPQMAEVTIPLFLELQEKLPALFDDIRLEA